MTIPWALHEREGDPIWVASMDPDLTLTVSVGCEWVWEWSIWSNAEGDVARGSVCVCEGDHPVGEWNYQHVERAQQRCEAIARAVPGTLPPSDDAGLHRIDLQAVQASDADLLRAELLRLREDIRQLTEQLRMWERSSNDFAPVDGSQEQRSVGTPSRGRRAPGAGIEPPSPGVRLSDHDPDVIRKRLGFVLDRLLEGKLEGKRSYADALDDLVDHVLFAYRRTD